METDIIILSTYETVFNNLGLKYKKSLLNGVRKYSMGTVDITRFQNAVTTMGYVTPDGYRLWVSDGWDNSGKGCYCRIDLFARNFTDEEYFSGATYKELGQIAFIIAYYERGRPYGFSSALPVRACDKKEVEE